MKTKYNIEKEFIEGYDIVDSVDGASFQNQLEGVFDGNKVTIDLSKSNFFLVDCELCSGSTCIIDIINYDKKIQRFEILLQESIEPKELIFTNSDTPSSEIHFPFKYTDDDDEVYEIEPMESQRRNQMLITFRTVQKFNDPFHLVGITTPWFESAITHSSMGILFLDTLNQRFPSNVNVKIWNSTDPSNIISEQFSQYGLYLDFLYKIPSYYEDNQCQFHYECSWAHRQGGGGIIHTDTGTFSKEQVNSGKVVLNISSQDKIPIWEPHFHPTGQPVASPYKEGDLVWHNPGGLIDGNNNATWNIYRRSERSISKKYPNINLEPGFIAFEVNNFNQFNWETFKLNLGAYVWDKWLPSGHPNANEGQGWYSFRGMATPYIEDPTWQNRVQAFVEKNVLNYVLYVVVMGISTVFGQPWVGIGVIAGDLVAGDPSEVDLLRKRGDMPDWLWERIQGEQHNPFYAPGSDLPGISPEHVWGEFWNLWIRIEDQFDSPPSS